MIRRSISLTGDVAEKVDAIATSQRVRGIVPSLIS
jgi:hypothetical protein